MAAKRPSMVHVAIDGRKREREDAPYQWVVEDRNVVGDCYESLLARLIFRSRLDEVKESGKAVDLCRVEAEEE